MEIINNRHGKILFTKLKAGDVFVYNSEYYIKSYSTLNLRYNAFNFTTNEFGCFSNDETMVDYIPDAKLVIS